MQWYGFNPCKLHRNRAAAKKYIGLQQLERKLSHYAETYEAIVLYAGNPEDVACIGTDSDHGVSTNKMSKRSNGWNERYNELVQYKRVHGNCNVPSGYRLNPALSQWVKRQRYQHKLKLNKEHTNLTPERFHMLQKLGFVWNAHEANWEESFTQLLKFKVEYGHCRVPTKYPVNQQLSVWVKLQRRQYRLFKASKSSTSPTEGDAKMTQTGMSSSSG